MSCDKRMTKENLLLYAVTDRTWLGESTLAQQAEAALKGGATCLQIREKELPRREFLAEAFALKALCQAYGVPLIVNDDVELAVACQADGVHVGQQDMAALRARELVGDKMILGVSVQTVEQALLAEEQGADYLGVGAIFPTGTKADADAVSIAALTAICGAVNIPVVAIGGINKSNLLQLSGSGIAGVALVSAIFAAPDIEAECRVLKELAARAVGLC